MVYERARAREGACQRDSARVPARASVGVLLSGRGRERERERVCICVFHVQGLDMTVGVLVDTCSISVQQRRVFYIWYICSSKHFSLALCSYMSLFVRVCNDGCQDLYICI